MFAVESLVFVRRSRVDRAGVVIVGNIPSDPGTQVIDGPSHIVSNRLRFDLQ
jgi:hypothetical protein